jgi:hypothetical protein
MIPSIRHFIPLVWRAGTIAAVLLLSGCVVGEAINYVSHAGSGTLESINKQRQLDRVARDWCQTIRASQVIPIYPLDEDVQPGDSYIVTTPIAELRSYWKQRGTLPIDHRFARFQPTGYPSYYPDGQYGVNDKDLLPRRWQFPKGASGFDDLKGALFEKDTDPTKQADRDAAAAKAADVEFLKTAWPAAPRAAFPSYTIKIKRGEGLNAALPVQGIPVALGALGAREATATVTLNDAYTYGIDEMSLRSDLASRSGFYQKYLADYAPQVVMKKSLFGGLVPTVTKKQMLRVVTRVYLVRSVNVSVVNTESSFWKASVGAPKEADADKTNSAAENLKLNDQPADSTTMSDLTGHLVSHTQGTLNTDKIDLQATPDKPSMPLTPPAEGAPALLPPLDNQIDDVEKDIARRERLEELARRETNLNNATLERKLKEQTFKSAVERTAMKDKFGTFVLPGGTLRVTSATQRSISMHETFTRPLVIGYHALEFEIGPAGDISTGPVSTFDRMQFGVDPVVRVATYNWDQLNRDVANWFNANPTTNLEIVKQWISRKRIKDRNGKPVLPPVFMTSDDYTAQLHAFATAHVY